MSDLVTIDEAVEIAYPGITKLALYDDVPMYNQWQRIVFDRIADENQTCKYACLRETLQLGVRPCQAIRKDQIPIVFTEESMQKLATEKLVDCELELKRINNMHDELKKKHDENMQTLERLKARGERFTGIAASLREMFPTKRMKTDEELRATFVKEEA
jgi:hypothetical protein